jgi:hypothetical protein
MYCPYCGDVMRQVESMLTCVQGDMPLSQTLQQLLTERFPIQRERSVHAEVGRRARRWFCPGCGILLGARMVCNECGQSLQDQLFTLVELHPHAPY